MRFRTGLISFIRILLLSFLPLGSAFGDALALQARLIQVFEQNQDAVVRVKAAYRGTGLTDDGREQITLRVGTGFFISREGHVLVSASRAVGAERVWVEFKDRNYATEAIGHDLLTNISVLRLLELPPDFSILAIDTSVQQPALGSLAVAIACALDFEPAPSLGIVTGIDKKLGNKVFPTAYIRTSLSVEAGRGGCPVFDLGGRLIGMSIASIPEIDGSYLLPVNALARVRDDLVFSGHIIHSWMGFEVGELLQSEDAHTVYFSKIIEGGPADLAGIQKDDRLVALGGRPIREVSDVPGAVFFTRANQFTEITVQRGEDLLVLSIKTQPRPEKEPLIDAEAATEMPAEVNLQEPDRK